MADLLFPDTLEDGSLYFAALDGPFFLPTATEPARHTLQGIAKLAFGKGTLVSDYFVSELTGFRHSPSWAPAIQTVVWCHLDRNAVTPVGVTLSHPGGDELNVFGPEFEGSPDNTLNLMTPELDVELLLADGNQLVVIRNIIAKHAQAFFSREQ